MSIWIKWVLSHNHLVFIFILVLVDPSPATSTCRRKGQFWCPSSEGHGDHYIKLVKLSCSGVEVGWERDVFHHYQKGKIPTRLELRGKGEKKSYKAREKRPQWSVELASPTREQLQHYWSPTAFFIALSVCNHG
jgi:hypothetical protein